MTLIENQVLKNTKIHQRRDARKIFKINWERERERERDNNLFCGKKKKTMYRMRERMINL